MVRYVCIIQYLSDVTKFLIIRRENRQVRVGGISVAPI